MEAFDSFGIRCSIRSVGDGVLCSVEILTVVGHHHLRCILVTDNLANQWTVCKLALVTSPFKPLRDLITRL